MPFAKRCVDPVNVCRQPLDPAVKFDLDAVSNNALVGALRQLASLAGHADDLFQELGEEFRSVVQRTERLKNRLDSVTETVQALDAKSVTVPVGDLATFTRVKDHFTAHHGFDETLFTPASRPDCLDKLYETAMASPVGHIRQCNEFRTDGRTGSKLFSLVPVFSKENLDPPPLEQDGFKKPTELMILEREAKTVPNYRRRPHSIGAASDLEFFKRTPPLPTPEDRVRELSRSQPSDLVPIDITGNSFDRMCEFRQSLKSASNEFVDGKKSKRKRRSQTISGIPGYIQDELSKGDYHEFKVISRSRTTSKERPKSTASTHHHYTSLTRGREREKKKMHTCSNGFLSCLSSQDTPVLKRSSLPRSRSLPRSSGKCRPVVGGLAARSASTDVWIEEEADAKLSTKQKKRFRVGLPRAHSVHGLRDLSTNTKDRSQLVSLARDFKRASTDLSTISVTSSSSSRSRPQSVEIRNPSMSFSSADPVRRSIPVPLMPSTDSINSSVDGSSRSSTLKSMNLINGVKMRQNICKATKEDRQSSSGNWSGSSSARQSLESDYQRSLASAEAANGNDKDSALSLNMPANADKEAADRLTTTSDSGGYGTESSTLVPDDDLSTSTMTSSTSYFTSMPSHLWLRSVQKERSLRLSMMDQTSTSSQDTLSSVAPPRLTVHNLKAHECALLPYLTQTAYKEEDSASLYSVDQEGFYTSFHMDSGIQKQKFQVLDDDALLTDNGMDKMVTGVPVFKERAVKMRRRSANASLLLCQLPKMMRNKRPKSKKIDAPPPIEDIDIKAMVSEALSSTAAGSSKINTDTPMQRFEKEPKRIGSKDDLMSSDSESRSSTLKSNCSSIRRQPVFNSWYKFDEDDLESQSTVSTKSSSRSSTILHGPAHDAVSVSESDAETIYARLKRKTSITSTTYPSICSVALDDSDDEHTVKSNNSRSNISMSYSMSSLKSSFSNKSDETVRSQYLPPWYPKAEENKYATLPAKLGSEKRKPVMNDYADISATLPRKQPSPMPEKKDAMSESDYATWPRSPMGHKMEIKTVSILKSSDHRKSGPPKPPRTLNFAPTVNMFDLEAQEIKPVLPEPLTPDDILEDRSISSENNSFKSMTTDPHPHITSPSGETEFSTNQTSVMTPNDVWSQSTTSSGFSGSMSSSSGSASTEGDEHAPDLPPRYQHSIRVRPGDKNKGPRKRRPVSLPPGVKRQHSIDESQPTNPDAKLLKRDHIYANVVVRKHHSVPNTPVIACPEINENTVTSITMTSMPLVDNSDLKPQTSGDYVRLQPPDVSTSDADVTSSSSSASVVVRRRVSTNIPDDSKSTKRNSHYASTDIFEFNNQLPSNPAAEFHPPTSVTALSSQVKHYAAASLPQSPTSPSSLSSTAPVPPKPVIYTSPGSQTSLPVNRSSSTQEKPAHDFIIISPPKSLTASQPASAPMQTFQAQIDSTGVLINNKDTTDSVDRGNGSIATIYKATARRSSLNNASVSAQPQEPEESSQITDGLTNVPEYKVLPIATTMSVFNKPVTLFPQVSNSSLPQPSLASISSITPESENMNNISMTTKTNSLGRSCSWYQPSIGSKSAVITAIPSSVSDSSIVSRQTPSVVSDGPNTAVHPVTNSDNAGHKNVYTSPTVTSQNVKTAKISSTKAVATSPVQSVDGVQPALVATSPVYSIGQAKILISPKNGPTVKCPGYAAPSKKTENSFTKGSKATSIPIIKATHPSQANRTSANKLPHQQSAVSTPGGSTSEGRSQEQGQGQASATKFSSCFLPFSQPLIKTDSSRVQSTNTSVPVNGNSTNGNVSNTSRVWPPLAPSQTLGSQNSNHVNMTRANSQAGQVNGPSSLLVHNRPRAASEEPSEKLSAPKSAPNNSSSMRNLFFQMDNGIGQETAAKPIGGSSWDRIITKTTTPPRSTSPKSSTSSLDKSVNGQEKAASFSFLKTPEGLFTGSNTSLDRVDTSSSSLRSSPPTVSNNEPRASSNKYITSPVTVTTHSNGSAAQNTHSNGSATQNTHSNGSATQNKAGASVVDEAAVMTILESIKSSLKVISENNNASRPVIASKQTAV